MALNKDFDTQHRAMKALFEQVEAKEGWRSQEQREAAKMVVMVLHSLSLNREPPKVLMDFLKENLAKLDPL